jgi:hypothetical protein
MPTTAISGCNGAVTGVGGAGAVGSEVTNWSATIEAEKIEATSFDSGCYQEWIQGVKSCEGSFEAIGSVAPVQGDVATLTLDVSTASGSFRISGPAIIFVIGPSVQVKGSAVTYSANFSYTGVFTIGTVP